VSVPRVNHSHRDRPKVPKLCVDADAGAGNLTFKIPANPWQSPATARHPQKPIHGSSASSGKLERLLLPQLLLLRTFIILRAPPTKTAPSHPALGLRIRSLWWRGRSFRPGVDSASIRPTISTFPMSQGSR
jgi:hypothetical protein